MAACLGFGASSLLVLSAFCHLRWQEVVVVGGSAPLLDALEGSGATPSLSPSALVVGVFSSLFAPPFRWRRLFAVVVVGFSLLLLSLLSLSLASSCHRCLVVIGGSFPPCGCFCQILRLVIVIAVAVGLSLLLSLLLL